jgi:hypothetical protein
MRLLLTASVDAGKGFCEDDLSTTAEEIPNGPVPEGQWQLTANTFSLKVLCFLYLLYLIYLSHIIFRAAGANVCSTHSVMSKFSSKFSSKVSSQVEVQVAGATNVSLEKEHHKYRSMRTYPNTYVGI